MNTEAAQFESERVKSFVEYTIEQMEHQGGDIRVFSFALLRAGAELLAELEGNDEMKSAMSILAQRLDIRNGIAGRA